MGRFLLVLQKTIHSNTSPLNFLQVSAVDCCKCNSHFETIQETLEVLYSYPVKLLCVHNTGLAVGCWLSIIQLTTRFRYALFPQAVGRGAGGRPTIIKIDFIFISRYIKVAAYIKTRDRVCVVPLVTWCLSITASIGLIKTLITLNLIVIVVRMLPVEGCELRNLFDSCSPSLATLGFDWALE